ncbi:hypothetical protein E4K65_42790 [Bradyrhizobium niftali]|uniref:Uncharacterized protein n=1 Tax=Bradyrhizobium niftali TaxID=2560055 RepID=A0A4Y9L546_9BRAD|nr:hypothetical protein E4K65_42790 [Bradyrhizobium niftali]
MVVPPGRLAPSAPANGSLGPIKGAKSLLASELNIRAANALDGARKMPPVARSERWSRRSSRSDAGCTCA